MKKILVLITLLISVFGLANAQSLEDLRKLAYEATLEALSKGHESAFEEYLEKRKIEEEKEAEKTKEEREAEEIEIVKKVKEAKAYFDRIDIMYRSLFLDPIIKGTCTLCFYSVLKPIWVYTFVGPDDSLWVNIFYYDNGKVGEIGYSDKIQSYWISPYYVKDTGEIVPYIKMKLDNGSLSFTQDVADPYKLNISFW